MKKKSLLHLPIANVGNRERWISSAAAAVLLAVGLKKRGTIGWTLAGLGTAFLLRGSTGYCAWYDAAAVNKATHHRGFHVDESIWIDVPRQTIFDYCREFQNLPRFLAHLDKVEPFNSHFSLWTAQAPGGFKVEWDTEIINEHPGEMIAWRSVPGSKVQMAGTFRFSDEANGTRVRLTLQYDPPGGVLGALVARFLENPQNEIRNDLLTLKRLFHGNRADGIESAHF